eukprot:scaffold1573_cov173-Amphora_coffeaeformis.AAC.3
MSGSDFRPWCDSDPRGTRQSQLTPSMVESYVVPSFKSSLLVSSKGKTDEDERLDGRSNFAGQRW